MKWPWCFRTDPYDEAALEEAQRRLEKALEEGKDIEALAQRLEHRRKQNHFGEKIHAALRGTT